MKGSTVIGLLSLRANDLDFQYLPDKVQASTPEYAELRTVVDASRFFCQGGHHIVLAMDCGGGQGSNNPHCGPIYRHGGNLFAIARGVIVLFDGTVLAETWNGTFSPGLVPVVNQAPGPFDPSTHSFMTVRVRCHYSGGISVRIRGGIGGPVVFDGDVATTAWSWPGYTRACVGGIALGFVPPKDTGCVEQLDPRSAPDAELGFAAFVRLE